MSETNRTVRVRVKTTVIETRVIEIDLDNTSEDFRSLVLEDLFEEAASGEAEIDYDVEDSDFDSELAEHEDAQPLGTDGAIADVEGRTIEWVELLPVEPPENLVRSAQGFLFERPDDYDSDELAAAGDAWRDEQEVS